MPKKQEPIATAQEETKQADPNQALVDKVKSLEEKLAQAEKELTEAGGTVPKVQSLAAAGEEAAAGTGVSVVSFTVESREAAENLASKLFKSELIGDAQILDGNYERMFMNYKKQSSEDHLVRMKFLTQDAKVAEVFKFVQQNNPNSKMKDVPADLMSTTLNAGSKEYLEWIKAQTTAATAEDTDLLQIGAEKTSVPRSTTQQTVKF